LKNVQMKVAGDKLTIEVDLTQDYGPSASGKTTIIASSAGNQPVPGREDVKVGVNIFRPR
jgi:hypothetical protein